MTKRGFSLIEMLIVMGIFTILFGAILSMLTSSDRSWKIEQNKLTEQQEARKAMGNIAVLLRQSSPDWVIEALHYPVTITANNRIDFYQPIFDASGGISALKKITFKLNPDDLHQLLKKEGDAAATVVGNNIESINFGGGCAGCSAFNCSSVTDDCPIVEITVETKKNIEFNLNSRITLRNASRTLADEVTVEQPEQGEF